MEQNLKIFAESVDGVVINQIYTIMAQPPFADAKIRIMPDTHIGTGCVVGFTSTMGNKVIPNIIGVDIGCGMLTVPLGKIDIDLKALDEFIIKTIPTGGNLRSQYSEVDLIKTLRCFSDLDDLDRIYRSLGTLGGGNHFIEIDTDEDGEKYLIIHTGSRNLGLQVAKIYQKRAVLACKSSADKARQEAHDKLMAQGKIEELYEENERITKMFAERTKTPADFCYFEGAECEDYLHDMRICQQFAIKNRKKIADDILKHLGIFKTANSFETMHNFIDDDGIIRKGAIPAHKGQLVLIPMNMRDGCIIAIGKGNEDWNFSAPHGAGRLFSRTEAKELFSEQEYKDTMKGIYTTSANMSTIDESPMAYKPMEEIVRLISPSVEIQKIIKPIYNLKHAKR